MNRIPERRRPLFVLAASLAVLLVVAGGVLLIGRLTPTPTPTTVPTSSATVVAVRGPIDSGGCRPCVLRRLQGGEADRRPCLDPSLRDRRTVVGLPLGSRTSYSARRQSRRRPSSRSSSSRTSTSSRLGDSATVQLVYTEGGYDISLDSGEPLESPGVLAPRDVTMELRQSRRSLVGRDLRGPGHGDQRCADARFLAACAGACVPSRSERPGCRGDRPGSRCASRQMDLRGSRLRRRHCDRKLGSASRVANACPDRVLLRVAEPGQSRPPTATRGGSGFIEPPTAAPSTSIARSRWFCAARSQPSGSARQGSAISASISRSALNL